MASEEELLARLERWLAEQPGEPTLFDILAARDGELLGAIVLKGFRAAAKQAVLDRIEREAPNMFPGPAVEPGNAVMRVFDGLTKAWSLTGPEQLMLLGLEEPAALVTLRHTSMTDLPVEVIERMAIILDVFRSINTLLPVPERADMWVRRPNAAPGFNGRSALDLMLEGIDGLRTVRSYLRGQLAGP